jgi:hypothetical protein
MRTKHHCPCNLTLNGTCYPRGICQVRTFQWRNGYFHDLCTPTIVIKGTPAEQFTDGPIANLTALEFDALRRRTICQVRHLRWLDVLTRCCSIRGCLGFRG